MKRTLWRPSKVSIFCCFICGIGSFSLISSVTGASNGKDISSTIKGKKTVSQLEVKSPDGFHSVVFSRPVASTDPDASYWEKIEVFHNKKGRIHIVEDPPNVVKAGCEAFQKYEAGEWSPDGRYLVVWNIINVDTGKAALGFLDICAGRWEEFEGKTVQGKSDIATTDNVARWQEGKPHTMLLIGEPPHWQKYTEAVPVSEPDPADCK